MSPSSSITVAPHGESWCVQLDGEMLTLHPNEEEARRSAEILSQRLRRQTEGAERTREG